MLNPAAAQIQLVLLPSWALRVHQLGTAKSPQLARLALIPHCSLKLPLARKFRGVSFSDDPTIAVDLASSRFTRAFNC